MKAQRMSGRRQAVLGAMGIFLLPAFFAEGASFQGLGELGVSNHGSYAFGISANGSVVVGETKSPNSVVGEAYRWTSSGGMQLLGDLAPGGIFVSSSTSISGDGSTVAGFASNSDNNLEAFRWTSGTGMVGLGDLTGNVTGSVAYGISSNGSVIVGRGISASGAEAFRWTGGVMTGLGDLPGGIFYSEAYGVSGDGSIVVGYSDSSNGSEAFRWTSGTGMIGLGDLSGGTFQSEANAISADGSVIVGYGMLDMFGAQAFRWTLEDGMEALSNGELGNTEALAISADGSVIVGGIGAIDAFVWTEAGGMQSLRDLLIASGIDLSDWVLGPATAVSADGMTIAGTGQRLSMGGTSEAWIAVIPEPSTWGLLLVAVGATAILCVRSAREKFRRAGCTQA